MSVRIPVDGVPSLGHGRNDVSGRFCSDTGFLVTIQICAKIWHRAYISP